MISLNENYAMPGMMENESRSSRYVPVPGGDKRNQGWPIPGNCWKPPDPAGRRLQADVWSCPSFQPTNWPVKAVDCEALEPAAPAGSATPVLRGTPARRPCGPVVASTDYMKSYAEQIRPFIPAGRGYKVLGTDGFGRDSPQQAA